MKKLVLLLATLASLIVPVAADAHPLGNFTVNRYSRVELAGRQVDVLYVLDLAEIPAYREQQTIRREGRQRWVSDTIARIRRGVTLTVDGKRAQLTPLRRQLAFPKGAAGLHTLRLEVVFGGPVLPKGGRQASLSYRDETYAGRLGWQEVVVQPGSGAKVLHSSVPARSVSHELRAYPKSFLSTPLSVRSATASFTAGDEIGPAPTLLSQANLDRPAEVYTGADARFSELIAEDGLSPLAIALALLAAMGLGMLHALTPGHGKSIVAAYLVGTRGRARHALYLGATVTVSHTLGVFALGIVTLSLSAFILPEDLYPWLTLASGVMVVAIGLAAFRVRLLRALRVRRAPAAQVYHVHLHHDHSHDHGHDHSHDHDHDHHHHDGPGGHSHVPAGEPSLRQLIGVGISGGILPCPSALVVLLSAIALHRVAFGLALITAFSIGLASVISGIGLIVLYARGIASRIPRSGGVISVLPAVSSAVITVAGLLIVLRAIPTVT
jgi:nickel/cobalt exporter